MANALTFTPDERAEIDRLAAAEGVSPDEAVMAAVRARLRELAPPSTNGRDLLARLDAAGVTDAFDGPPDLSSNPAYLEGYGE